LSENSPHEASQTGQGGGRGSSTNSSWLTQGGEGGTDFRDIEREGW